MFLSGTWCWFKAQCYPTVTIVPCMVPLHGEGYTDMLKDHGFATL